MTDIGFIIADSNRLILFDYNLNQTGEIITDFSPSMLTFRQLDTNNINLITLFGENEIQLYMGKNNSYLNLKELFGNITIPAEDNNHKFSHKEIMMPNDSTISVISYGFGLMPTLFRNIRIPNVLNLITQLSPKQISPQMTEWLEAGESNILAMYNKNGELLQKWALPSNEQVNKIIHFSESDSIILIQNNLNQIYKLSKSGECTLLKIPDISESGITTYNPEMHMLAYVGNDANRGGNGVFLFDINTLTEIMYIPLHEECYDIKILDFCNAIAFSTGEVIHLFSLKPDVNNQIHYDDIPLGKAHYCNNFSVSEASRSIAISTLQGQLFLIRDYKGIGSSSTILMKTLPKDGYVYSTSWSPDGKKLVIDFHSPEMNNKFDILIYDVDAWRQIDKYTSLLPFNNSIFSIDMNYIISSDGQSSITMPYNTLLDLVRWFSELYK